MIKVIGRILNHPESVHHTPGRAWAGLLKRLRRPPNESPAAVSAGLDGIAALEKHYRDGLSLAGRIRDIKTDLDRFAATVSTLALDVGHALGTTAVETARGLIDRTAAASAAEAAWGQARRTMLSTAEAEEKARLELRAAQAWLDAVIASCGATDGPGWGLVIDAASYLASACCLLAIRPSTEPAPSVVGRGSVRGELLAAVQAIRETRWIGLIVVQYGFLTMLAISPFNVIVPVILSHAPAGAGAWGTLLSAIGVGAVLGAVGCARYQPRRMLLGVEVAATMLAAPILMLVVDVPFPVVVLGCGIYGVGAAMLSILTITAIQRAVPRSMLSRIMAMVQLASMGPMPLGYVLAGPALVVFGPTKCLAASDFFILTSVVVMLGQRDVRRFQCSS